VAGELSAAMVIVNELTTLLTSHELYRRTESASRSSERERFKKIMQIEQDVDEAVSRLLRIRKPVDTKRTIDAASCTTTALPNEVNHQGTRDSDVETQIVNDSVAEVEPEERSAPPTSQILGHLTDDAVLRNSENTDEVSIIDASAGPTP